MFEGIFEDPYLHFFQCFQVELEVMLTTVFILANLANVVYLYFNFLGGIC